MHESAVPIHNSFEKLGAALFELGAGGQDLTNRGVCGRGSESAPEGRSATFGRCLNCVLRDDRTLVQCCAICFCDLGQDIAEVALFVRR